jgi:hypothetical protein
MANALKFFVKTVMQIWSKSGLLKIFEFVVLLHKVSPEFMILAFHDFFMVPNGGGGPPVYD